MTYNPRELIGPVGNYPLYVKKVFLSFLQAYFSQYNRIDSRFYWTSDFRTTKILIVDKKSYDTGTHEKRPTIVINRGPMVMMNTSINQLSDFNLVTGASTYSDLLSTQISFNCIGKNGIELEELASIILNAIIGFKSELRKEGIHQITRLAVGQEVQLRNDVDDVFAVVPIELGFTFQIEVAQKFKYYPLTVKYEATHVPETTDSTPNPYWETPTKSWFDRSKSLTMAITLTENTDYEITTSGLLSFTNAPVANYYIVSGEQSTTGPSDGTLPSLGSSDGLDAPGYLPNGALTWEVWYTRADTLEEATYTLPADDVTTDFELPGGIYGYGTVFQTFNLTETTSDDVGWGAADD